MAKFTSTRLRRDTSYGTSAERSFRKALRNKRTHGALTQYLAKRGRKGYSSGSFKNWLRQERLTNKGKTMGAVGEKKVAAFLEDYGKTGSSGPAQVASHESASHSSYASEKLAKAAAQRKKRRVAQQKRQIKSEFGNGSQFSGPVRSSREGVVFDPRAGTSGPRVSTGARSAPDFARSARNLRPH